MNEKTKETKIFEDYPIPKAVMALAVPTVITQLINIIYNFADTWFVGRTENAAAVAALSVCMPVYIIMAGLANLFGIGGASVISRSLGAKKTDKARSTFAFSLWGGLIVAAVYSLAIAIFRGGIIPLIGGDDASYAYVYDYMFWTMIIGSIPTVMNVLFGHLVRSIGASKEASIGMSMGCILNIILDPLFMFVLLPAGHEVTGAAVATLISNCAATLYFVIFLLRHKDNPVFTLNPKDVDVKHGIPGEVLLVGFPAALSTILAMVSNIFANALVAGYGSAAVAGMGVAKKINTLAFNTTMGLTQGVLPLLGYNYASGDHKRMKNTIWFTGGVALTFSLICLCLFRGFDSHLIRFFIADAETVRFGEMFLDVIAFAVPLCAFTYMINTVFQATGKKANSLVLSILRKGCLDIPAMFLFSSFIGAAGVVWATPFAEIVSTVIAIVMFALFMRKMDGGKK